MFKDILQLEGVRHADKLLRLLPALDIQIVREYLESRSSVAQARHGP